MPKEKKYTITDGRLGRAYLSGFCREGAGRLSLKHEGWENRHLLILPAFNSFEKESVWGRFRLKANLPDHCRLIIRAFALDTLKLADESKIKVLESFFRDSKRTIGEKVSIFEKADCITGINHEDVLLYDLKGQYLWICIEITGEGAGCLSDMVLENPGDNFMQTFPEIYQEPGGFFHRYMSIFSTLYYGINRELDEICQFLSIDKAPEWMLPHFAEWLGFELDGEYLDADIVRKLLKDIYQLNRMKGTKKAIAKLVELILKKPVTIIERNRLEGYIAREDKEIYRRLYGDSMQDVTILINAKADEKLQAQMDYLIRQFAPVRSHVKLVFYRDCNRLDSYCYLDKNAVLAEYGYGTMDTQAAMDGSVMLQ